MPTLRILKRLLSRARFLLAEPESPLARCVRRGMVVGRDCSFQEGVVFDESHCWLIRIGNQVTLAPFVYILAHDASPIKPIGYARIGRVSIEDRVFIGARAMVLPGVTVGEGAIVGAGSVVTKSVPARMVAAGNPARIMYSVDDFVRKHRENMVRAPVFTWEDRCRLDAEPAWREELYRRLDAGVGYIP